MTNIVTFTRALADETRWRIARLAMEETLCVCELADVLEMPQSSVSSHVQVIRKAGLLESEKCEKWTYFRIAPEFRNVIGGLIEFFESNGGTHFPADFAKMQARLKERAASCCPGPQRLKSPTASEVCFSTN